MKKIILLAFASVFFYAKGQSSQNAIKWQIHDLIESMGKNFLTWNKCNGTNHETGFCYVCRPDSTVTLFSRNTEQQLTVKMHDEEQQMVFVSFYEQGEEFGINEKRDLVCKEIIALPISRERTDSLVAGILSYRTNACQDYSGFERNIKFWSEFFK